MQDNRIAFHGLAQSCCCRPFLQDISIRNVVSFLPVFVSDKNLRATPTLASHLPNTSLTKTIDSCQSRQIHTVCQGEAAGLLILSAHMNALAAGIATQCMYVSEQQHVQLHALHMGMQHVSQLTSQNSYVSWQVVTIAQVCST